MEHSIQLCIFLNNVYNYVFSWTMYTTMYFLEQCIQLGIFLNIASYYVSWPIFCRVQPGCNNNSTNCTTLDNQLETGVAFSKDCYICQECRLASSQPWQLQSVKFIPCVNYAEIYCPWLTTTTRPTCDAQTSKHHCKSPYLWLFVQLQSPAAAAAVCIH